MPTDSSLSVKPPVGVPPTDLSRAVAAPSPGAVKTELAPSQTVNASAKAEKAGLNLPQTQKQPSPQNTAKQTTQQVVIDPRGQEVVFRLLDARTRQVVRQVPDEALLRARAYARALDNGKSTGEALLLANRKV